MNGALVALGASLQPDRDTARTWAEQELARPEYRADRPSLVHRFVQWLQAQLDRLPSPGHVDLRWGLLVVGAIVLGLVGYVLWRNGGVRRRATVTGDLFGGTLRTAAEHRTAAEAAEAAGDLRTAVLERFRALLRSLAERDLVDLAPGSTADEAVRAAGAWLPGLAGDLLGAARTFDDVRYGDRPATRDQAATLRELDRRAEATRPAGERHDVADLAVPR